MAKKPIKKPGRPAKRAPKVQKFAKGEEVFALAPGVLNEPPKGGAAAAGSNQSFADPSWDGSLGDGVPSHQFTKMNRMSLYANSAVPPAAQPNRPIHTGAQPGAQFREAEQRNLAALGNAVRQGGVAAGSAASGLYGMATNGMVPPGVGQDPVSRRIQSGVDKTRAAVSRGVNAVGEASVQAPNDPLTANAVARARGKGGQSAASAAKDAYLNWYNQNKGVANPSPSAAVTSADMGGAPASGYGAVPQWLSGLVSPAKASQYSPEQLAAIRQYATQRGLSPDMGMERNPPGPAGLARPPAGVDPYLGLVGAYKAKQPETGSMDSYQPSDSAPAAYLTGGGMDAYSPEPDLPSGMFARSGQAPSFAPQVYRQITAGGSIPAASTQTPGAVPAAAPVAQPSSGATVSREDSNLRIGQPIDMKSLTPSDMSYLSNLQAAGGRVRTDSKGNFQGYEMPPDGRVSAAGLAQQVRTAGQGLNWDAFSPENVARARRESRPPSDTGGAMGSSYGNTQADYDNALLQKWYSMAPSERGAMPASVMEAKHRGATPQDTAMNIARARIMESGLPPERISESLGKLEQIRAYLEAQTANTAHVGRQDEMQAARDAEIVRKNQAGEQLTAEEQASLDASRRGTVEAARMAAENTAQANRDTAAFNQGRLDIMGQENAQKDKRFRAMPEISPDITEKANPTLYKQMVDNQRNWLAAQQDWYNLASENRGASDDELMQRAFAPTNGKLRPAAYYYDPEFLGRRRSSPTPYASGGMVQSPVYAGSPSLPRIDPIMADYRQYVLRAQQQGVPTVPFTQFAQLKAGSFQGQPQQPVAMARGGAVPAAGKMVIDTNPNAKTDSIPAVIDGKSPARLDSGEFVIPAAVVRHYGTKFLHNLIEKANGAM